jgi:hypothetical protein
MEICVLSPNSAAAIVISGIIRSSIILSPADIYEIIKDRVNICWFFMIILKNCRFSSFRLLSKIIFTTCLIHCD